MVVAYDMPLGQPVMLALNDIKRQWQSIRGRVSGEFHALTELVCFGAGRAFQLIRNTQEHAYYVVHFMCAGVGAHAAGYR